MSDLENRWFSKHLRAAGEPVLVGTPADQAVYLRFTWLRTFHDPVIIRIQSTGPRMRLTAKQLSGSGGYDPGVVERTIERDLTPSEVNELNTILAQTRLFSQPPSECGAGCDSAQWVFEGADKRGFHLVSRWSPEKGAARQVGLLLLEWTGWTFKEVY